MNPVPEHIAIIMDGNGRWANKHDLPRIDGHKKGVEIVDDVVEACLDLGVKYLTLYAFSDENWGRPQEEVDSLMVLLAMYVRAKCEKMVSKGIKFGTIGDIKKLPDDALNEIIRVKKETENGERLNLILALSYGAHSEIVRACNRAIQNGTKNITESDINAGLDSCGMPNPDLLIRTSGELRISNFMLWQIAYTELYFTKILWPDFNRKELFKAVNNYRRRDRRFGRVSERG